MSWRLNILCFLFLNRKKMGVDRVTTFLRCADMVQDAAQFGFKAISLLCTYYELLSYVY